MHFLVTIIFPEKNFGSSNEVSKPRLVGLRAKRKGIRKSAASPVKNTNSRQVKVDFKWKHAISILSPFPRKILAWFGPFRIREGPSNFRPNRSGFSPARVGAVATLKSVLVKSSTFFIRKTSIALRVREISDLSRQEEVQETDGVRARGPMSPERRVIFQFPDQ